MPTSASSRISAGSLDFSAATTWIARLTRERSPPEAMRASGRGRILRIRHDVIFDGVEAAFVFCLGEHEFEASARDAEAVDVRGDLASEFLRSAPAFARQLCAGRSERLLGVEHLLPNRIEILIAYAQRAQFVREFLLAFREHLGPQSMFAGEFSDAIEAGFDAFEFIRCVRHLVEIAAQLARCLVEMRQRGVEQFARAHERCVAVVDASEQRSDARDVRHAGFRLAFQHIQCGADARLDVLRFRHAPVTVVQILVLAVGDGQLGKFSQLIFQQGSPVARLLGFGFERVQRVGGASPGPIRIADAAQRALPRLRSGRADPAARRAVATTDVRSGRGCRSALLRVRRDRSRSRVRH